MTTLVPLPHQVEGIRLLEACDGRTLLADDMGLGKTMQVLTCLARHPEWMPAVISCPTTAKWNWEHEAKTFFNLNVSVCNGKKPPSSRRQGSARSDIMVVNHNILQDWAEYFVQAGIKTLVLDECHHFSNPEAKRTMAATMLSREADRTLGLSGTPMTKQPIDMYPVISMIWPKAFPSLYQYAQTYCAPKWRPWGWDFTGSSNLDILYERLKSLGMIRRRQSVLNLPPMVRRMVPVDMIRPEEYYHATNDFLGWLKLTAPQRVRAAKKNERLVKVGYLLRLTARLKLPAVVQKAEKFLNKGDKLVMMAVHKKFIDIMMEKATCRAVRITGDVVGKDRFLAVDQFQNDKATRLCCGNVNSAGTAITLTAAQRIMFGEFWYAPASLLQAEKRIHRIGQTLPCTADYLVARGTIEEHVCEILQTRQRAIEKAIDGEVTVDTDYNLYEELLDQIEERLL